MRNILIVGICGAGKSTLAQALARQLGLRHIELDALRHGPRWGVRASFAHDVAALTATDGWVADSTAYPEVLPGLWARADTAIWLELGRGVVLGRVLRRTARRLLARETLWAGNRETWLGVLSRRSPAMKVLLDFRTRREQERRMLARFDGTVVRLRTPAEVAAYLAGVRGEGPGHGEEHGGRGHRDDTRGSDVLGGR
ncbi:adenylate kinase [Streptomyces sp. NPDC058000]|uniref:adenylate kinase n=1 Tax=Streptomyces sp. NPDC058000 TaxID=3346299 RepID=UPI0036E5BC31